MLFQLKHYQKLEHRYLVTIKSLRGGSYVMGISLEGIAIGLQFTLIGLPISILAGLSGLRVPMLVEFIIKLINNKRQKYLKKIIHIKEYLDKLYLFIEEAKQDKVISLEEIERFQSIIDDFNGKLKVIDSTQTDIQKDEIKISLNELMKILQTHHQK